MISFSTLILNNEKPVYLQMVDYIKKQIHLNNINDGDELPSRRELAGILGINPNTVQKSYKELQNKGLIFTASNVKSVIIVNDEIKNKIARELKNEAALKFIEFSKSINMTFKDTIELLTELWD